MLVRIFTDGACSNNPGPGGWAIVVNKKEEHEVYSGGENETTNNKMELLAAYKALCYILKYNVPRASIISDSAYVVNAIQKKWLESWSANNWSTSKGEPVKNAELWKGIEKALNAVTKRGLDVQFVKVKGHSGNMFNELADEHARMEVEKIKERVG